MYMQTCLEESTPPCVLDETFDRRDAGRSDINADELNCTHPARWWLQKTRQDCDILELIGGLPQHGPPTAPAREMVVPAKACRLGFVMQEQDGIQHVVRRELTGCGCLAAFGVCKGKVFSPQPCRPQSSRPLPTPMEESSLLLATHQFQPQGPDLSLSR